MPDFTKSPPELVERFTSLTADLPGAERRQMFGYPCLFVGGNMVTGLHGASWFVRLSDDDRAELLGHDGAGPFEVMPGRPMAGYLILPPSILADEGATRRWVRRAIEHGLSLPAKATRTPKTRAGRRA
jgi:TfoX/Sxy family transcriptional regulator of competence genes